jgi:hypothetical protein
MYGTGVNQRRKGHLMNPAQALIIRMRNNFEYERVIDCDKAINRVIDNLP